jgi:hypothetical protein
VKESLKKCKIASSKYRVYKDDISVFYRKFIESEMSANLMIDFRGSGKSFPKLHDELVVAGEQVPSAPGEVEGVGHQGHAVIKMTLCLNVL